MRLAAGLLACAALAIGGASASGVPTLEQCDERVRDAPDDPDSYYCYLLSVRSHGRADDAVRRLDAILAVDPERHRARLNLAMIEDMRRAPRAEALMRRVADDLAAAGDRAGEVYARRGYAYRLGEWRRLDEADAQLDLAYAAAEAAESPLLLAWVWTDRAAQASRREDHGKARRLYRKAEALAFPGGQPFLKAYILGGLGVACWSLGDLGSALDYFRRSANVSRESGDRYGEGMALYNVALLTAQLQGRGRLDLEEASAAASEALRAARRTGNRATEARVRLLLGNDLEGEEAIGEYELALDLARQAGEIETILQARRLIAKETFELGPEHQEKALRGVEEAIGEARRRGMPFDVARGLILRAEQAWVAWPRERAHVAFGEALSEVERLRDLQPDSEVRARVFSQWVYPYYRLSGRLLEGLDRSAMPDADLQLAFATMERMRARVLLDQLESAGAATGGRLGDPLQIERSALLERISATQRELTGQRDDTLQRDELLADLERLESEEVDLADRIARADPAEAALRRPEFPDLDEVREALGPDRAILAFQTPADHHGRDDRQRQEGGSWVALVSREIVRPFRIPASRVLEEQVDVYRGLIGRRDGSEAAASVRLYDDLLSGALNALPRSVTRLILVPDGGLHGLPFSTLRSAADTPPLAALFDLSYVPSVTIWMRWRAEATPSRSSALALVDPEIDAEFSSAFRATGGRWIDPLPGSLANARREARSLLRAFDDGVLRAGAEASERFLKEFDLAPYGLLHLGAHAVVDPSFPSRAAVVLAPGSPAEDGLLQVREIVDLDLDGRVVVLAACRTATGEAIGGEGVMGLARAFFRAGARTVVASLWPVRDDETAAVVEGLAREIGRGRSVGAALAAARRERIEDGAPAEAWAGLIVLGDADVVPMGGAAGRWPAGRLALYAAVVAALLAAASWVARRYRTHSSAAS